MHKETQREDMPKWSALLVEAVTRPGLIMDAYNVFWSYSVGNQILALTQCELRSLPPGPINTYPGWQALGRNVKRGERALTLCMPITRKRRDETEDNKGETSVEHAYTSFIYKAAWFVVSQTIGEEFTPPQLPAWDAQRALANLDIQLIDFAETDGNIQGYARLRQVAINPVAQLKIKTLLHEVAHVTLAHTSEDDFADGQRTPRVKRRTRAIQTLDLALATQTTRLLSARLYKKDRHATVSLLPSIGQSDCRVEMTTRNRAKGQN